MNDYKIDELYVGMTETFTRTITEDMMKKFLEISGDENPLHTDSEFAKSKHFPDKVVYGMLTVSLISTLGGMYLPGKNCLIQGVEINFIKPVYVGDELTVTGEVTEIYKDLNRIIIKVTIRNQNNQKVVRGILKAGVLA